MQHLTRFHLYLWRTWFSIALMMFFTEAFQPMARLNYRNLPPIGQVGARVDRRQLHWKPSKIWASIPGGEDDSVSDAICSAAAEGLLVESNQAVIDPNSVELHKEVEHSFLQYALSIILGRALPDARDGLKPVHRRILYSMHQLHLNPSTAHRKCARVVGEVLGKYHPHGDTAVYDALVRMAQDFSTHYRLIDGHGNFGSVDADPPAAMRYTECRLTSLATETLLSDITENTVDFAPNFDGNEMEPAVLPAKLPFLLLNGSSGIAVGMATNIPPHNLREILAACTALVGSRVDHMLGASHEVSDDDLCQIVKGPDFPTGASILRNEAIRQLYTTGKGGIIMRAVTELETVTSGNQKRTAIVVKELPYQVNKAALLEKIAALVNDKKMDGIADLRDESDRDGIRVVLELKRDAVPAIVLNNLYKHTPLQTTFSGNFLAVMDSTLEGTDTVSDEDTGNQDSTSTMKPQRFTLRQSLDYFLDFRFETIRRKSAFQLSKVEARKHTVEGLLLALEKVDDVISLIRSAPSQAAVRDALQDPNGVLQLSKEQADSVLKLQLGQLTRLNHEKLAEEKADLETQQGRLNHLLEDGKEVYGLMTEEFQELDAKFGSERKTKILDDVDGEVTDLDLVENSRSVVVVTRDGYIKRMPMQTFHSQGRGTRGKQGASTSTAGDAEVAHVITCNDHDTLLMITQNGLAYGLRAFEVPNASRIAKGTPLPAVLPIGREEVVTAILPVSSFGESDFIVLATEQGWIKKTPLEAFETMDRRGLTIASLSEGDRLKWCHRCDSSSNDVVVSTDSGLTSRFASQSIRPSGRRSRGVRAMNLRNGDRVVDMNILATNTTQDNRQGTTGEEFILFVTAQGYGKRVRAKEFRKANRGTLGVVGIKCKAQHQEDSLSGVCIVQDDDEVLINSARGVMVRQKVQQIPVQGRAATGVLLQKLDDGDHITSVNVVPKEYDAESS